MESQNVQLLLNLQLQAKTISKYDKYFTYLMENGQMPEVEDEDDQFLEEEEEEDEEEEEKEK